MCLVPLECVCLFCKFGAFSEILGIKICARAKAARSAKLIAILPRLKFYPGYEPARTITRQLSVVFHVTG